MSDGITLICPSCGEYSALKKEYDELKVKIKNQSLKHPEDYVDYSIPVYTCQKCGKKFAIERVI
jgi:transposase